MSKQGIPPPQKTNFGTPPPGYIAGWGRGAVGFITRSDIGPSKINGEAQFFTAKPEDDDRGDYSDSKYDSWAGYEGSLFAHQGDLDDEDREAEEAFDFVDRYMDQRRKARREKRMKEELERYKKEKPAINEQFKDTKRQLATLSYEEWMNIPEAGDYKVKKQKREKYVPVPDTIIESARREGEITTSINPMDGTQSGTITNLNELGAARGQLLSLRLDSASDSVTGQTVVNPKEYVSDLSSLPVFSMNADVGDWKKTRLLLKSAIESNPKNAACWIAAARVEELDGKLQAARSFIHRGLEHCKDSEDLWLEAARLETIDKARAILAEGVKNMPHSVKIWLAAADKENDVGIKKKILQRALEYNAKSLRLWKELIELGNEEEARDYLRKAVKCIPNRLELWLALAKLEDYERAKEVLKEARVALPTEPAIYVYAAKLEETQGNIDNVKKVINRGLIFLTNNGVTIKREDWLKEAETAEKSGSVETSRAIVACTAESGVDPDDFERVWMEDAENALNNGCVETARALYTYTVNKFPEKENVWLTLIEFEKKHGTTERVDQVLQNAIEKSANSEIFWLMRAKLKLQNNDVESARAILAKAFEVHPNSEKIYLAAAKLERELQNYERAREIYRTARENCIQPKIWMQSAQLEREVHQEKEALALVKEGIQKFPNFPKLWMIAGQLYEQFGDNNLAAKYYEEGVNHNKNSVPLWICWINLEIKQGNFAKARSIWERARIKNPNSSDLWYTAVKLELADKNPTGAKYNLNRGLQEVPKSGELWALSIEMEPRHLRTAKSLEAMKQCDNDAFVILAVAKQFWREKKYEKAKKWLERAVIVNKDYGDAWVYYYMFERDHGEKGGTEDILKRVKEAEPHHGRLWISVSKKVENWRLKSDEILLKAVEHIEGEFDVIE